MREQRQIYDPSREYTPGELNDTDGEQDLRQAMDTAYSGGYADGFATAHHLGNISLRLAIENAVREWTNTRTEPTLSYWEGMYGGLEKVRKRRYKEPSHWKY